MLDTFVVFAPKNLGLVEAALSRELAGWATISKADLDYTRKELLTRRQKARAEDQSLAATLAHHSRLGRTISWDEDLERKYLALTPDEVSAAVRKLFDPAQQVVVRAGDFKPIAAPR